MMSPFVAGEQCKQCTCNKVAVYLIDFVDNATQSHNNQA